MKRLPTTLRRALFVLLLLTLAFGALNVAAAATLQVSAGKLTAFDQAVERCAPQVPLTRVRNASATVAVVGYHVPAECIGLPAQTTLYASNGAALGSGSGTIATPSFILPIAPAASNANFFGLALAVGGLQVGLGGSDVQPELVINDWGSGYCVDVTLTTTSSTTISRSVEIALTRHPLNGEVYNRWGAVTHSGGVVTTSGNLSSTSNLTGGWCANRTGPVEPGPVEVVVTPRSNQTETNYCADVEVFNHGAEPVTWEVEIDVAEHHAYGRGLGTMNTHWNANATYDGVRTITASGSGWTEQIPAGDSREWGYCMSNLQPLPEPPPPGTTYTATIVSPTTHGGTTYTTSVQVTTNATSTVPWTVEVDVSKYGLPTSISSVTGATSWSYDAPILTVSGAAVSSSSPASFSYTAQGVGPIEPTAENSAGSFVHTTQGNCNPNNTNTITVNVRTNTGDWHPWYVELHLPNASGQPTGVTGAIVTWDETTKRLTAKGTASNWAIKSGTTRSFTYCIK